MAGDFLKIVMAVLPGPVEIFRQWIPADPQWSVVFLRFCNAFPFVRVEAESDEYGTSLGEGGVAFLDSLLFVDVVAERMSVGLSGQFLLDPCLANEGFKFHGAAVLAGVLR